MPKRIRFPPMSALRKLMVGIIGVDKDTWMCISAQNLQDGKLRGTNSDSLRAEVVSINRQPRPANANDVRTSLISDAAV